MSMLPEMVIKEQARRIRELKEENARLINLIDDLVMQGCSSLDETDETIDSMAISTYEEAIDLLVEKGILVLIPAGRTIARRALEKEQQ